MLEKLTRTPAGDKTGLAGGDGYNAHTDERTLQGMSRYSKSAISGCGG